MTDVATPLPPADAGHRPAPVPAVLATGLFGGFVLGVIARAWMRLIAEDPDFTWSGTIFIIAGFTIFGLTQSIAAVARQRAARRWTLTVARVWGVIGMMPLFVAAGALMMPTVVGAGLARSRRDWRKWVRIVCIVAAAGPVVLVGNQLVGSFGWSAHALAGFLLMLAVYGTIVAATRFTMMPLADGWRLKGQFKVAILVVVGLILTYSLVGLVG